MSNILEIDNFSEIDNKSVALILLYQNFCGTCDIAKRMVNIVSNTLPSIKYYQLNFTGKGDIVLKYKVRSIPYFLVMKDNQIVESFAAFHSVTYLYELLNKYM